MFQKVVDVFVRSFLCLRLRSEKNNHLHSCICMFTPMQVPSKHVGQTIELCCVKNSGHDRRHSSIALQSMHGQSELHTRLENFYRVYNPSKLEDDEFVPRVVLFYKGVPE